MLYLTIKFITIWRYSDLNKLQYHCTTPYRYFIEMTLPVTDRIKSFKDLRRNFYLEQSKDPTFFSELSENLQELTVT